ncbi:hypothetical protein ACFQX6_54210 [Streptosporangium lutulentum]
MSTASDPTADRPLAEESDSITSASDSRTGRLFAALPVQDAPAMARLHERLIDRAQREGILDVAYRTLDSPVGTLLLAATAQGLVKIAFAVQDHDAVLRQLAERVSPRILNAPRRLDETS